MWLREFKGKVCDYVVAVVGQPSVGKSTFFTQVTGEVTHIANWPGTTVEQRVGFVTFEGKSICMIDLPGVHGLTPTSPEERITKNYLLSGDWDAVLVLADPLVLERSIYLPIQVGEMSDKLVVALTKWDEVHKRGLHIDVGKLSSRLGVPVITLSSITGVGVKQVLSVLVKVAEGGLKGEFIHVDYGLLESYLSELTELVKASNVERLPSRWVALRLLEEDPEVIELLREMPEVLKEGKRLREEFRKATGRTPEEVAISGRYQYASQMLKDVIIRVKVRPHATAVVDRIYLHPIIGPVISVLTMFLVFATAFMLNTGFPLTLILRYVGLDTVADVLQYYSLSGLLEGVFVYVSEVIRPTLESVDTALASLLVDGVLGGVGSVLSFLPLIFLISAFITILEDSGLGPRMVSSLHSFFRYFGLSGRALYPLVMGFGCNVPAVSQSRIFIDEAERLEVIMSVPFILCQARLIVLLYFTRILLPSNVFLQATVMVLLYVTSIILYLLTAKLIRRLLSVKEAPELIMELPLIHRASARVVWWGSWSSTKHFLYKAGVIILVLSVISWITLNYGPAGRVATPVESYGGVLGTHVGRALEPLYGLSNETSWMVGYALTYGFIAKEGLITSISQLTGTSE
ncbi:MAG: ferrous iron transport protein B, partial [Zestosphaera sp.]